MAEPFTIRIFLPDGAYDGVRIIDRMNWTGQVVAFSRADWDKIKGRREIRHAGVYILVGTNVDDELPELYIGQTDELHRRMGNHVKNDLKMAFWDEAVFFYSTNDGLNRAHITWLEWALVQRAKQTNRSHLKNVVSPEEPILTEAEKADTYAFLQEIYQILPVAGLKAFEKKKSVSIDEKPARSEPTPVQADNSYLPDTVIVAARKYNFERQFLGEHAWSSIRISRVMLDQLKYIAAYQTAPISAVTHIAQIDRIEEYGEQGKYKLFFKGQATELERPVPVGDPNYSIQGPRYTTKSKLEQAKSVVEV